MTSIELLVIDDGSDDRTSEVARELGVQRVVRFPARRGLARAFDRGLREALDMGADVIVNTDADNQYVGADVGKLVEPILSRRADMVVGSRPIESIQHFSPLKKALQRLGSRVVRALSQSDVPDATSGFRAYSREAALRLTVLTGFTYTLETLIQASQKNITIAHVPIRVNGKTRESRLFSGMGAYVTRSLGTMIRVYLLYRPLRFFLTLAAMFGMGVAGCCSCASWSCSSPRPGRQVTCSRSSWPVRSPSSRGCSWRSACSRDLTAMNRRLLDEIVVNTRLQQLRTGRASDRQDRA